MNAHAWISRNGSPRRSAKAKATVTEVENGSPTPSATGPRATGRAGDWVLGRRAGVWARERLACGGGGAGRVIRGPLVGRGEGGGVREPGERPGASRQRLRQLAMGTLRRRAGAELPQRHVEDVQERAALPQTTCEQHRKDRDAEQ